MPDPKSNFDLIEDFFDGNLNEEELAQFNKRLEKDPEFTKQFNFRKNLAEKWLAAREYETIKDQVGRIIKESKSRALFRKYYLPVAASIIILLGIYGVIRLANYNEDSERIAQDQEEIIIPDTTADSTKKDKLLIPQIDELEFKANIEYFQDPDSINLLMQNITLTTPINNEKYTVSDSIELAWETTINQEFYLYIFSISEDTMIFKTRIDLSKGKYLVQSNALEIGSYYWFLVSPEKHGKFIISNNN